jgi:alanyl-tRNA synthetase
MTVKLYESSQYLKEWQTEIMKIMEKDGKYHIILKDTAFYPEGGGQPSDRGWIDNIPVEHVYEENDEIYHVLPSTVEKINVTCKIDFDRRFDHMQQHTGQHLLSATLYNMFKAKTSSLHMGEDIISVDISLPEISQETLRDVEEAVNDVIYKNLPVRAHCVKPEEAKKFPLRRPPPQTDKIRIMEIELVDFSPCCGTHVTMTGEIGIVKILRAEKMRGLTRIYFKCGKRALNDYRLKQDIVTGLSKQFSSEENEIMLRAAAQAEQIKVLLKELNDLNEKSLVAEAKEIASSASSKLIILSFNDKGFDDINKLQQYLLKHGDIIVILSSVPEKRLIFAYSGNYGLHCGNLLKGSLPMFNGKGGGKDKWANAGFNRLEDMSGFIEHLKMSLLEKDLF